MDEPHMSRFVPVILLAIVAGCHREHAPTDEEPSSSASAIRLPIAMALGTCDDLSICERECKGGSADRCRRLAASYALGQGTEKDEGEATLLYAQACGMNDPPSCMFAGQMHEFAHGVDKDDAKAATFYKRACDLAWAPGCYNFAIMYERGTGVPADREKARDLYQRACTGGAKSACDKAKEMAAPPIPAFLEGGLP